MTIRYFDTIDADSSRVMYATCSSVLEYESSLYFDDKVGTNSTSRIMFRPFYLLLLLCFAGLSSAFRAPSALRPAGRVMRKLQMEDEKPAWVGAKKFSMKDRYTETVIDSENISKILPHR